MMGARKIACALALVIAMSVVASGASIAGTDDPDVEAAESLLADPRLETVKGELEQIFEAAVAKGVPAGILEAKIREGLTKKADPAKIVAAVGKLADRCASGVELLVDAGSPTDPKAIAMIAELLALEVPPKEIVETVAASGPQEKDPGALHKALLEKLAAAEKAAAAKHKADEPKSKSKSKSKSKPKSKPGQGGTHQPGKAKPHAK